MNKYYMSHEERYKRRKQIINALKNLTYEEVASKFNLTSEYIKIIERTFKENSKNIEKKREKEKTICEYLKTHSIKETQTKYKTSISYIRHLQVKYDIKPVFKGTTPNYKIIGLILATKISYEEIAKICGVTRARVYQISDHLKKVNIPVREQ